MKLLILILLLLFPSWINAAVVHVQSTGDTASGQVSFWEVSLTGVVNGNALLAAGHCYSFRCTTTTVWSDDKSNSWINVTSGVSDANPAGYAVGVTGGTVITRLTPNVGADFIGYGVSEFSGVATVSPLDQVNVGGGVSTAASSGSISTTSSGVIYATVKAADSATTFTQAGGFTLVHEDETFNCCPFSTVYQIGAAGTYEATWTLGTSNTWTAVIFSLKAEATVGRRPIAPIIY